MKGEPRVAKLRSAARKERSRRWALPAARLNALIEEASVDARDDSEQTTGFYAMLEIPSQSGSRRRSSASRSSSSGST